jgi:hypothetical protein
MKFNRWSAINVLAPLVTLIGANTLLATPSWSATLARSEATITLDNFSELPLDVDAFSITNTQAISGNGTVESIADADAFFLVDQLNPSQASTTALSQVNGEGSAYVGIAEGLARVIGLSFSIEAGTTFSFDFNTALNLTTSIDQPDIETAVSIGVIFLGLYDAVDTTFSNPLDFFTISSTLGSLGKNNTLDVDQSAGITLSSSQLSLDSFLGGQQGFASATIQGSLSHYFDSPTTLTLVAYNLNQTIASVPEPSNTLVVFLLMGSLGMTRLYRRFYST